MTGEGWHPGTVYLLHFDRPYKHARHYIGWTLNLDARLAAHRAGHGSRLLHAVRAAGIGWALARTWPGDRTRERQVKAQGGAARCCPLCSTRPRLQGDHPMTTATRPSPVYDHQGRYVLPDPDTGQQARWTRASTLAKALTDTTLLTRWQCRMVAKGIAARPDLHALAAATPAEDKQTLNQVCEDAKHAAAAASRANLGTALHRFTERLDLGEDLHIPDPWAADIDAYRARLAAEGITFEAAHIERTVIVPELGAAGTFDRIANLPGAGPVIADIKTADDLTYGWGEIAIQLATYAHGHGLWNGPGYDPMPTLNTHRALVIHLPAGQARCDLHWIDIAAGWDAAQLAADVRAWRTRRDLTNAIPAPGTLSARTAAAGSDAA